MPSSAVFVCSNLIEIFFYSFHLSMLIMMIVKQKDVFKGSFFNIFRTVLIADFVCYFNLILAQKLPLIYSLIDFYKKSVYFVTISYNIMSCATAIQFLGHLFLALNRFTIIWFPLKHEKIWCRQWYTVVIIVLPILIICWRFDQPVVCVFAEDETFYLVFVNNYVSKISYSIATALYLSSTCLAGILNFLAFLKFIFHKQNGATVNVNERNLLLVSFVIFIVQLFRLSHNIGNMIFGSKPEVLLFLNTILPYLNDIFAWSGSVSLCVLSSSTRTTYTSLYFCKSHNIVVHQALSTSNKNINTATIRL